MSSRISRRALLNIACGGAAVATSGRLAAAASPVPPMAADAATELYYRDDWLGEPWRTPEAVMLIHGVYESSIAWYGWVPRMAQQFRVLRPICRAPDARRSRRGSSGRCRASPARSRVSSTESAWSPCTSSGPSSAGSIAMQFAADYPKRTRTLVVVSGPVSRPVIATPPPAGAPQGARLGSGAPKEQVDYWNAMMAASNREASQGAGRVLSAMDLEPVVRDHRAHPGRHLRP